GLEPDALGLAQGVINQPGIGHPPALGKPGPHLFKDARGKPGAGARQITMERTTRQDAARGLGGTGRRLPAVEIPEDEAALEAPPVIDDRAHAVPGPSPAREDHAAI